MSRVAKKPITIPSGVEVKVHDQEVHAKGSKGQGKMELDKQVKVNIESNVITITACGESIYANAISGTTRAKLNNLVEGVSKGFERKLTLIGVGYRAAAQGKVLNLTLGYSHPVEFRIPEGITIETPSQTEILIKGVDKQLVGQVAADIRDMRAPEPYKGKGVRYADEVINLKETKKK